VNWALFSFHVFRMTSPERSALMSRIRGSDTTPELILRRRLWADGLRYRLKYKVPTGRPDLVFPGARVAVFVDGCFWHGCPDHYVRPRSRSTFWAQKLAENVERDQRQTRELESAGWKVVRIWEHEIHEALDEVVERVAEAMAGLESDNDAPRWQVVSVEVIDEAEALERRRLTRLRDPLSVRIDQQKRHTRKWRERPR